MSLCQKRGGLRLVTWMFLLSFFFFFSPCRNFHAGFSLARGALLHVSSARHPEIVHCSGELPREAGKQSDLSVYGTYGVKNSSICPSAPARRCRRGFPWMSLISQCLHSFLSRAILRKSESYYGIASLPRRCGRRNWNTLAVPPPQPTRLSPSSTL